MLRKRIGESLQIDIVSGTDFPEDLTPYDLIIHCGACMFNRKYVLNRIDRARTQQVPMINYGVTIAYLAGILNKIDYLYKKECHLPSGKQHSFSFILLKINTPLLAQSLQSVERADCSPNEYARTKHPQTPPVPASADGSCHSHPEARRNDSSTE